MKPKSKKEINRQILERLSDIQGDISFMSMFWSMFDDLSFTDQKYYIERAKMILHEEYGHSMESIEKWISEGE